MKPHSNTGFRIADRIRSFRAAWKGLRFAIRFEHNLQIHLLVAGLVVVSGIAFNLSKTEWMLVSFAIVLVISAELMNTAIEKLADALHPENHPGVGLAKDLAAAAVLVTAIGASIVGGIVFWPHFIEALEATSGI